MLPKKHRFSFKRGVPRRLYTTPFFVIRYGDSNGSGLHAAVVVGKKVDKRAVLRNRYKRQVVEWTKTLLQKEQNINVVIFAKKQIMQLQKESLYEELKKSFQTIHLLS